MTDKIEPAAHSEKAEDNGSKLLNDSGLLQGHRSIFSPHPDADGNIYMCFRKNGGGQFINGHDWNEMDNNLQKTMRSVAEEVSKANNGAEIHVSGALSSMYRSSFCSGGGDFPDEIVVGSGKAEGPLKLPNKDELEARVKALTKQYQDSLKGDWGRFKELNITGDITIVDPKSDTAILDASDHRKVMNPQEK